MSTRAKSTFKDSAIEVLSRQRKVKVDRPAIVKLGTRILNRIGKSGSRATVVFVRDPEMRRLNREFRKIDKPTDVLAFAYAETLGDDEPVADPDFLGDVIISVDTAERYAAEQKINYDVEVGWLVIHGILHLAGYDHETDNGEMARLERRLRKTLLATGPGR